MGLTAQVNETVKQRRAPNVMPENTVYYACTRTLIPAFHIQRGGGAGGRRGGGAGPPVGSATSGRSFEAGGRKSLSQTRRCLISSRILASRRGNVSIIKTGADDNEIHDVSRRGFMRQMCLKATIGTFEYGCFHKASEMLMKIFAKRKSNVFN